MVKIRNALFTVTHDMTLRFDIIKYKFSFYSFNLSPTSPTWSVLLLLFVKISATTEASCRVKLLFGLLSKKSACRDRRQNKHQNRGSGSEVNQDDVDVALVFKFAFPGKFLQTNRNVRDLLLLL